MSASRLGLANVHQSSHRAHQRFHRPMSTISGRRARQFRGLSGPRTREVADRRDTHSVHPTRAPRPRPFGLAHDIVVPTWRSLSSSDLGVVSGPRVSVRSCSGWCIHHAVRQATPMLASRSPATCPASRASESSSARCPPAASRSCLNVVRSSRAPGRREMRCLS